MGILFFLNHTGTMSSSQNYCIQNIFSYIILFVILFVLRYWIIRYYLISFRYRITTNYRVNYNKFLQVFPYHAQIFLYPLYFLNHILKDRTISHISEPCKVIFLAYFYHNKTAYKAGQKNNIKFLFSMPLLFS